MAKRSNHSRSGGQVKKPRSSGGRAATNRLDSAAELATLQSEKQQLGERLAELSGLDDLSADVGTTELLRSILARCLKIFDCASGSIFLFKPETEELELAVAEGPMREALLGVRQSLGTGVAGTVAERKQGIFVEDISKSSEFSPRGSPRYETNSFACVPITYRGALLGVLSLCDKRSGQPFDAADVGWMLAIAGFSAGSIRQSLQQEKLRGFNIELHRRLDAAIERLQSANQELARLKNFNESILTSIAFGLIAFDEAMHITFCNEPARQILRLGPPETLDEKLQQLMISCDGLAWPSVLQAVVGEGRAIRCGNAEFVPEGTGELNPERRILSLSASPLRGAHRKVSGGVIVIEDVTERSKMEKRLAASERHAVIGKLAARVAHELNNPLDGILRFINLSIALKGEDDPTREYLTECKKGLERMVGIVGSLLEFSRSTYPAHRDTRLNEVIQEAVRTLRHRAEQQGIKVTFHLDEKLPELRCGELVQVFLNLAKNAYDAMKDGGEFTVSTRLIGDEVVATFADTGCGIPKEILPRIFDPFFTTKAPSEGTGLGLAICHDIVEKHGGKITVESQVGKGTTFTVTLPVTS